MSYCLFISSSRNEDCFRTAKDKLPKDIEKKVKDWNFSSGALVLCLVAYSDGNEVQSFQLVHSHQSMLLA